MFKVKQLFTKKYLLLLHIVFVLVYFNSFEVIRSQSLMSQKVIKIQTDRSLLLTNINTKRLNNAMRHNWKIRK